MKSAETTLVFPVHFGTSQHGKKKIRQGPKPKPVKVPDGHVPSIAKLMARAIHAGELIRAGQIADYADLARLSECTRARATQVMSLLRLAPSIQEEILHLPLAHSGREPITERMLRHVVKEPDWEKQQQLWEQVKRNAQVRIES